VGTLKRVVLPAQSIIYEAGDTPTRAYFPHSGAIALVVVLSSGGMIETALIRREGMVGGFATLSSHPASCRAIVRFEGAASVIDLALLRQIANAH
jgi:CRP-like cAMP-binding protein